MLNSLLSRYTRTLSLVLALLLVIVLERFEVRTSISGNALPFFEWMRNSF